MTLYDNDTILVDIDNMFVTRVVNDRKFTHQAKVRIKSCRVY